MGNFSLPAEQVRIDVGTARLEGELCLVSDSRGLVLITNGSDSSRFSPRCQLVCDQLNQAQLSTLLFNVLTPREEEIDLQTQRLRYQIPLLNRRIVGTLDWVHQQRDLNHLRAGILAAGTAAGAALVAATERPQLIDAVVCRGGWPELAGDALPFVAAPTLMIVGSYDASALAANEDARRQLRVKSVIRIVPQASNLFEEPGTMQAMASQAADWFATHLDPQQADYASEIALSNS